MKPLDEMDLSLVLPRPGRFDGPPFPGESHIPALILGILEGCVIVLQHYLREDTIPAPAFGLREGTEKIFHVKKMHNVKTEACKFIHSYSSDEKLIYQSCDLQ